MSRRSAAPSDIGKYLYWSDRAVQTIAQDNGIELVGRGRWTLGLNWKVFQASVASRERTTRNRLEEARRLEKKIADAAIQDFDTPPPAAFVKGVGSVSFARFAEWHGRREGAIMHTRACSAHGQRVDICLFGSMDNVSGFGPYDDFTAGWTSSAAPAIGELLESKGTRNTSQWDDDQSRSVEALKIVLHQGSAGIAEDHADGPEARGFTIGHSGDCQFFAEIYTDVVLDPQRWNFKDDLVGTQRIMVGRPVWIRSMSPAAVVRYAELRNASERTRWRRLRRLHLLPRRHPVAIGLSVEHQIQDAIVRQQDRKRDPLP